MLTATERLHRLRSLTFSKVAVAVIILCTLGGLVLGYLRAQRMPFIFKVATTVLVHVGREGAGARPEVTFAGGSPFITEVPRSENLNTEIQLLKSTELMREVYDSIVEEGGDTTPKQRGEDGGGGGSIMSSLFTGINSIKRVLQLEYETDPSVAKFQSFKNRFTFSAVPKSTIIQISCTSPFPELAKLHLERFLSKYKDFHMRAFSKGENTALFEKQLEAVTTQIHDAERAITDFKREHKVNDVGSAVDRLSVQRESTVAKLRGLEARAAATTARLERLVADLESNKYPEMSRMTKQVVRNPMFEYLERLAVDADLHVADLSDKYVDSSRWISDARAKYDRTMKLLESQQLVRDGNEAFGRDPIHTDLTKSRLQAETELLAIEAERSVHDATLASINSEIDKLLGLRIEYDHLLTTARELKLDRAEIFESVRLGKNNTVLDNARITNLKVITPPTIPEQPQKRFGMSPRTFSVLSGGAVGLFLALAFFLVRGAVRESNLQRKALDAAQPEDSEDVFVVTDTTGGLPAELAPNAPGPETSKGKRKRRSDAS